MSPKRFSDDLLNFEDKAGSVTRLGPPGLTTGRTFIEGIMAFELGGRGGREDMGSTWISVEMIGSIGT